jgi:hypothetical protein
MSNYRQPGRPGTGSTPAGKKETTGQLSLFFKAFVRSTRPPPPGLMKLLFNIAVGLAARLPGGVKFS